MGGRVARPAEAIPLDTIEINPLRVDRSQIELVVWDEDKDKDKEQPKENDL